MTNQLKGILLITLSAVGFGSYGIWSRIMGNSFDEFSQGWIRAFILIAIIIPIILWKKQYRKIARTDWKWFAAIAGAGGLNQAPYYFAFKYLPIGTATLLFYASLTITGYIVGYIFLHERIDTKKITSLVLACVGISCIFKFSITTLSLTLPALSAVLAGAMGGIEVGLTKKISDRYSTLQIISVIFLFMLVGNIGIASIAGMKIPTFTTYIPWFGLLGYTVAMLIALYTVVIGYQYAEASVGGLVGLSEIVFAALFGVVFFHEVISLSSILGATLIILAAALPYLQFSKNLKTFF